MRAARIRKSTLTVLLLSSLGPGITHCFRWLFRGITSDVNRSAPDLGTRPAASRARRSTVPDIAPGAEADAAPASRRAKVDNVGSVHAAADPRALRGQALDDRLLFGCAQGVLAGLMDCTPDDAGHALLAAAADLGQSPRATAEALLEIMGTSDRRHEPLMPLLAAAIAQRPVRMRAFDGLWDDHGAACYSLAVAILGKGQTAEDALRSAFLAAWRNQNVCGDIDAERATLLDLTHREAIASLRKQRLIAAEIQPCGPGAETDNTNHPDAHRLRLRGGNIGNLTDAEEQIVRLGYIGGHTQREIATITGRSLNEVRAAMLAAVQKLVAARKIAIRADPSAGPAI